MSKGIIFGSWLPILHPESGVHDQACAADRVRAIVPAAEIERFAAELRGDPQMLPDLGRSPAAWTHGASGARHHSCIR